MAAPTFVQEAETAYSTTSPKTTAAFNVAAGEVLVAVVAGADQGDTATISNNGAATTWVQEQVVSVGSYCWLSVWTTTPGARTGMTVTFTRSGGSNFFGGNVLTIGSTAGVDSSDTKTNVASGAPSLAITPTVANCMVIAFSADWTAADGTSRTWRTINSITPTAGNGRERTYFRDAAQYTVYGAYWEDVGTAAAKTTGLSAPGSQKYSIIAVALKPSAGVAVTLDPATETDAAQALSFQKVAALTPATETDGAQALVATKFVSFTAATETDAAQGLSFHRSVTLSPATETDAAQALTLQKLASLAPAGETNVAQALSFFKSVTLEPATEVDEAQDLGLTFATFYTLTPAAETDAALPLALTRVITLTPATETDVAQSLSFTSGGGNGGARITTQRVRHFSGVRQADVEGVQSNI